VRRLTCCATVLVLAALCVWLPGCGGKAGAAPDPAAGAPPKAQVEEEHNGDVFKVDHPEQFPLVAAAKYVATPELNATGTVNPDVSRNVPVISLASGRIIEMNARLGDSVTKGQLLMKVQSADISQAFSDYRQAVADQVLSQAQLDRAKILYDKGAIAQKDLEVAQDAEAKAKVTVETAQEHLRVLGADPQNPTAIVNIYAPISGVITDQQATAAGGTQGLSSPNAFTISDLSHVWIICDVYENDLHFVRMGEYADVHLNAYPKLVLRGQVSNIGPILDPNIRTAKVRLQVPNTGVLRFGMFVTATFNSQDKQTLAAVPSSAILHLHDRDWVYVPIEGNRFRRVEVNGGKMLPEGRQEVTGIQPGQQVVVNALVLQATAEQ
jgi:cobalt-zinc-cadmium efflux system membrane fusion protein